MSLAVAVPEGTVSVVTALLVCVVCTKYRESFRNVLGRLSISKMVYEVADVHPVTETETHCTCLGDTHAQIAAREVPDMVVMPTCFHRLPAESVTLTAGALPGLVKVCGPMFQPMYAISMVPVPGFRTE